MNTHQEPLSKPCAIFTASEPLADSQCDVTDAWNEQNDPQNAEGATVTAYFDHEYNHGQTQATMIGLAVEIDDTTLYYTACAARGMLGSDNAWRIELLHSEGLS